jgi:site-specific DNA-methyltransferase (adenine-specific)
MKAITVPISKVTNEDCMAMMARFPDKYFELAIVDPPYGININSSGRLGHYGGKGKKWDDKTPDERYFTELYRVSGSQIIWGGNYFDLPPTRCFLIWDKQQPSDVSFAGAEYAWTSFDKSAKVFRQRPQGDDRIHPTQKPIQLYKWLLTNYAKPGDKILDTHLGSGSSRIAAYNMGFDFWGCELDPDYFAAMEKRFKKQTAQQSLFAV